MRGATNSAGPDEMPATYAGLRTEIACLGAEQENTSDIFRAKMQALGGMNYISVENINAANKNRREALRDFIESAYPYIELPPAEAAKSDSGSIESLIQEYKRIFGEPKPQAKQ